MQGINAFPCESHLAEHRLRIRNSNRLIRVSRVAARLRSTLLGHLPQPALAFGVTSRAGGRSSAPARTRTLEGMFSSLIRTLVVVGAQWGDEGKGKLVDVIAERADWVVRYQGGANAGHTVKFGDRAFVLHQIPSGILHPGVRCAIGNGVVLDPETLFTEIDELVRDGVDVEGRLYVSDRAHLVLPYHKLVDGQSAASRAIGTTGRGIGPAYEDKIARRGVRVLDLRHPEKLRELLEAGIAHANAQLVAFGIEPAREH